MKSEQCSEKIKVIFCFSRKKNIKKNSFSMSDLYKIKLNIIKINLKFIYF